MPTKNIFAGQSARAVFAQYVYEALRRREFASLMDVLCAYYQRDKSYYDLHTYSSDKATLRNRLIGCYFVEYDQKGYNRGKYGDRLLRQLVERVNTKGLKETLFRNSKTFYQPYSQVSALFKKSATPSHKLMAEISPTASD